MTPRVLDNQKQIFSSGSDSLLRAAVTWGSINHAGHISILMARVVVRAMGINASRGCKHMSWCADEEQRVGSEIDLTRRAWISTDAYMQTTIFAFHARCILGATWNSSVKAMEQLKGPLTVRRRACGTLCFSGRTKVYSRGRSCAATATQRKRYFVNAKSFPLTRKWILTSSCDFYNNVWTIDSALNRTILPILSWYIINTHIKHIFCLINLHSYYINLYSYITPWNRCEFETKVLLIICIDNVWHVKVLHTKFIHWI